MKIVWPCFALLALVLAHAPAFAADYQCAGVFNSQDNEWDYSATAKLIRAQTSCWAADDVFNNCPHGAMYSSEGDTSILDHSADLISICKKSIAKDRKIQKMYNAYYAKYCDRSNSKGTRQDVAHEDECDRALATSLGKIVEGVVKH